MRALISDQRVRALDKVVFGPAGLRRRNRGFLRISPIGTPSARKAVIVPRQNALEPVVATGCMLPAMTIKDENAVRTEVKALIAATTSADYPSAPRS
jgi:hypothetical protein